MDDLSLTCTKLMTVERSRIVGRLGSGVCVTTSFHIFALMNATTHLLKQFSRVFGHLAARHYCRPSDLPLSLTATDPRRPGAVAPVVPNMVCTSPYILDTGGIHVI